MASDDLTSGAHGNDLGPMPEPQVEPGDPPPGGVDAVEDGTVPGAIPDIVPSTNPAFEASESVTAEVSEREDTSTQATRDEDTEPDKESPA